MGIKSKNAPKVVGSTIFGGGAAVFASKSMMPVLEAVSGGAGFEGGNPVEEVDYRSQVLGFKKKYELSMKAPITPTINCFVGMLFMKLLLAGIVNS